MRLAGLSAGATAVADATYPPRNADGGAIGVASNSSATPYIAGLRGTYIVCSAGILGKFAKQLDTAMDDGCTNSGSLMAIAGHPAGTTSGNAPAGLTTAEGGVCVGAAAIDDGASYTVCMGI